MTASTRWSINSGTPETQDWGELQVHAQVQLVAPRLACSLPCILEFGKAALGENMPSSVGYKGLDGCSRGRHTAYLCFFSHFRFPPAIRQLGQQSKRKKQPPLARLRTISSLAQHRHCGRPASVTHEQSGHHSFAVGTLQLLQLDSYALLPATCPAVATARISSSNPATWTNRMPASSNERRPVLSLTNFSGSMTPT